MINQPKPKKILDFIHQAIIDGIKKEVEREFESAKKIAIENIDRRKVEVVAGITLDIMSMTDFQNLNDRVVFTIRKEKEMSKLPLCPACTKKQREKWKKEKRTQRAKPPTPHKK